jgi:hypothetical protein
VSFEIGTRIRYCPTPDMDKEELQLRDSLGRVVARHPDEGWLFVKWDWNHLVTECNETLVERE